MLGDVSLATLWEYTVVPDGWGGFWHKGGGLLGGQAKSFPEARDISKCTEKSFCEIDSVDVRTSLSRYAGAFLARLHRRARVGMLAASRGLRRCQCLQRSRLITESILGDCLIVSHLFNLDLSKFAVRI